MIREKRLAYFGGIPTAIDVKKIDDEIGVPDEGDVIGYDKLEQVIGKERKSCRFKTVIDAWRKKLLRENNVLMLAVAGEGLVAASPAERVSYSSKRITGSYRQISKWVIVNETTETKRLQADELKVHKSIMEIGDNLRKSNLRLAYIVRPEKEKLPSGL